MEFDSKDVPGIASVPHPLWANEPRKPEEATFTGDRGQAEEQATGLRVALGWLPNKKDDTPLSVYRAAIASV